MSAPLGCFNKCAPIFRTSRLHVTPVESSGLWDPAAEAASRFSVVFDHFEERLLLCNGREVVSVALQGGEAKEGLPEVVLGKEKGCSISSIHSMQKKDCVIALGRHGFGVFVVDLRRRTVSPLYKRYDGRFRKYSGCQADLSLGLLVLWGRWPESKLSRDSHKGSVSPYIDDLQAGPEDRPYVYSQNSDNEVLSNIEVRDLASGKHLLKINACCLACYMNCPDLPWSHGMRDDYSFSESIAVDGVCFEPGRLCAPGRLSAEDRFEGARKAMRRRRRRLPAGEDAEETIDMSGYSSAQDSEKEGPGLPRGTCPPLLVGSTGRVVLRWDTTTRRHTPLVGGASQLRDMSFRGLDGKPMFPRPEVSFDGVGLDADFQGLELDFMLPTCRGVLLSDGPRFSSKYGSSRHGCVRTLRLLNSQTSEVLTPGFIGPASEIACDGLWDAQCSSQDGSKVFLVRFCGDEADVCVVHMDRDAALPLAYTVPPSLSSGSAEVRFEVVKDKQVVERFSIPLWITVQTSDFFRTMFEGTGASYSDGRSRCVSIHLSNEVTLEGVKALLHFWRTDSLDVFAFAKSRPQWKSWPVRRGLIEDELQNRTLLEACRYTLEARKVADFYQVFRLLALAEEALKEIVCCHPGCAVMALSHLGIPEKDALVRTVFLSVSEVAWHHLTHGEGWTWIASNQPEWIPQAVDIDPDLAASLLGAIEKFT